jgi:hypothetical protein
MESPCLRGASSALAARLPPELEKLGEKTGIFSFPPSTANFEHDPE